MENELAHQYAIALFELTSKQALSYLDALKSIQETLDDNKDFYKFLASRSIDYQKKEETIDKISTLFKLEHLSSFLKLLVKRHRLGLLKEINAEYLSLYNDSIKAKEGLIYSVKPLKETDIKKIEKSLEKRFGCKISLQNKIDESLIGGVRVYIDGKLFDGSIKTRLIELEKTLLGG